jgi:pyruvate/oxaloacetate carboxyltransferase
MSRRLKIRDLTLRDGQQSLFATRMPQADIDRVLPLYRNAGFYAMEVWGGAVPDSIMRFLNENPWTRLESIKNEVGGTTLLAALSRGRNLFGYNPYPESVIEGFNRNAVISGVGIMRIFDCLNDVENIRSTIKYVKDAGGLADCAVCFTIDPKLPEKEELRKKLTRKDLPGKIFDVQYFIDKAKAMEAMGADMISLKDMAGLASPIETARIIKGFKENLKVPVDFHTHCTPGYGLASTLTAILNGADIIDTNLLYFAGGSAGPAWELVYLFCKKLEIEVDGNPEVIPQINVLLKDIRLNSLASVDSYKQIPIDFDIAKDTLPENIDKLFDDAITFAKEENEDKLLVACHAIEQYFNFPAPEERVKRAEIPGGMYTNMLSQLKQLGLAHLLDRVLEVVPVVRLDAGCPPLVTPSSQIVGAQAVNCVIDENAGKPFYTNISNQFLNMVKGEYGETPIPISPEFRKKICGFADERPYDIGSYKSPENPILKEVGGVKLAKDEKEMLLLELFPAVANDFLLKQRKAEFEKIRKERKIQKAEARKNMTFKGKLQIRDLTLRDGQQSMLATRMSLPQVESVLPLYKEAGFYALEVWGGAVPDSVMRYLNEDPWYRLRVIKKGIGESSKLTALSRGRNLFGYDPYPEDVIEGFNRLSVKHGVDIMRIFDCLNDLNNMRTTIKYVKDSNGLADCAICYTVNPKFSGKQKAIAFIKGKKLPTEVFTIDYFVEKAKELERMGADMITIKDMAGLITPTDAGELVSKLKKAVKVPIDFHTHCTPGYGLASTLMAILNGADMVDTCILNFAGGPAAPAFEIIQIFADKLGIDTGVNLDAVVKINRELKRIRIELAEYDSYKQFPIDFDITSDDLPVEVEKWFDDAISFARSGKEDDLLEVTRKIEAWFNLIAPDNMVRDAEIPGGMYTNMLAQLRQMKMEQLLPRVLEMVPLVRIESGCPPLVTPTSQIVGAQAVNCVISQSQGKDLYSNVSTQYFNLVKGLYGKTPIPIAPEFRKKICGSEEEVPFNSLHYKVQDNPIILEDFGGIQLAATEEERLLLELFPNVARNYLLNRKETEVFELKRQIAQEMNAVSEEKRKEFMNLSDEEKAERIMRGLQYNDSETNW